MEFTHNQWNTLTHTSPQASFLQSWEWGEFQKRLAVTAWRIGSGEAGALVLERVVRRGWSWLYVPRGPIFSTHPPTPVAWENVQGELLELGKRAEAIFIRVEPSIGDASLLASRGWRKADHDVQPRHTLLLSLKDSPETILKNMHAKTRYNIRLAEKRGVTVRFSTDPRDVEVFLELSTDVQERSPFRYHPPEYYRAMAEVLMPAGLLEIAIAEREGKPLAAHILIFYNGVATYVHGASSSQGREFMGPHVVQWESIKRGQEKRCHTYDFFGIAPPEADPSHSWTGITRFKLGFGGKRVQYIGAYDYVLNPAWYTAFTLARRIRTFIA